MVMTCDGVAAADSAVKPWMSQNRMVMPENDWLM